MVWYFIGVYIINGTWPLGDTKFLFSCSKIFRLKITSKISSICKITKMIYMLWLAKRYESICKQSCEIMTFCSPCTNHAIMILKNVLSFKLNRCTLSYLLFFDVWNLKDFCKHAELILFFFYVFNQADILSNKVLAYLP